MADFLVLIVGEAVTVLGTAGTTPNEINEFIDKVVDHAGEPVQTGIVEISQLSDWGPGDIADALTIGDDTEVPVSSLFTRRP